MVLRSGPVMAFVCFCAFVFPARAETSGFANVLSAVTLDFNDDGAMDRAVLVQNEDAGADLYLYLSKTDPNSPAVLALAETKQGVAYSGAMWGQLPSLEVNGRGSLVVKSENESIGRDRWSQSATVVYRNKEFLIGGITFTSRDTLDPEKESSCDLNLLSGKGLRNGKPIATKLKALRLADWSDDKLPKECRF